MTLTIANAGVWKQSGCGCHARQSGVDIQRALLLFCPSCGRHHIPRLQCHPDPRASFPRSQLLIFFSCRSGGGRRLGFLLYGRGRSHPSCRSMNGGDAVTIAGDLFSRGLQCVFNWTSLVPTVFLDVNTLRCTTPSVSIPGRPASLCPFPTFTEKEWFSWD